MDDKTYRRMSWGCSCGHVARSAIAEARHRHNFPLLCRSTRAWSGNREKLWPRVLKALTALGQATASEIAREIGEDARSVYASMSSMGRYRRRWWIEPLGYWDREARFAITLDGRDVAGRVK